MPLLIGWPSPRQTPPFREPRQFGPFEYLKPMPRSQQFSL
jgi:hypothetical protein